MAAVGETGATGDNNDATGVLVTSVAGVGRAAYAGLRFPVGVGGAVAVSLSMTSTLLSPVLHMGQAPGTLAD
jgi:hypothetical protein